MLGKTKSKKGRIIYFILEWRFIKPPVSAYRLIKLVAFPHFYESAKMGTCSWGEVKLKDLEDVEISRYGSQIDVYCNNI